MGILIACNDISVLNPESPSKVTPVRIYSNYSLAVSAVDGIIEPAMSANCYRGRYLSYFGYNTDIEWGLRPTGDLDKELAEYNAYPTQQRLNASNESFSSLYRSIERANLAIKYLRLYGDVGNNHDMAVLLAESLTLRAYFYFDLIKAFGDVPARFEPVTAETIYQKKVNRDIIFKQILSDLDQAIPVLAYPGQSERTMTACRINKILAEGLYARIVLFATGYALRPADDQIGTGHPGVIRLSSDPEITKEKLYPRALKHLQDAIESDVMSLAPDYYEYWRGVNNSEHILKPTEETVYSLPFGDTWGRWNFSFAVRVQNVDMFGYNITRSPFAGPVPSLFFDFDAEDKRRDVTCVNYRQENTAPVLSGMAFWYFGKYRFDQMENNPYKNANDDGIKPVMMRYSDIYLMASEIANELGELGLAKKYFKPVRARAFDEAKAETFLQSISSKEEMFEAIIDERAFEFCGEFLRKTDLIRWHRLKSNMDIAKQKLYDLRDRKGEYSWLPSDVYYRVSPENKWELEIYGLSKGETGRPEGEGWRQRGGYVIDYDDHNNTNLSSGRIEALYVNNPDKRQFWPIPALSITASQGALVNDYGY